MNRAQRIVLILLNSTLVVDLILYLVKGASVVGGPFTIVSGGLALVCVILAVANQSATRWVSLVAALIAMVGALAS
ncbi:MAG: hypothetical protein JSU96_02975 [Acidobacteriota bacterium]|nr:MAG: hypothetical protein JSU96_02975 [Acidobacteriota bacterium]